MPISDVGTTKEVIETHLAQTLKGVTYNHDDHDPRDLVRTSVLQAGGTVIQIRLLPGASDSITGGGTRRSRLDAYEVVVLGSLVGTGGSEAPEFERRARLKALGVLAGSVWDEMQPHRFTEAGYQSAVGGLFALADIDFNFGGYAVEVNITQLS